MASAASGHGTAPLRVLLVEDAPILAARLAELITQLGEVNLVGVVDGQSAAITALERELPDVLILDLQLKEGTGFGVLRALRPGLAHPHAVVLTNYTLPEYRRQAEALGAALFLDKSRDYGRLLELLRRMSLEKSRHLDA